MSHIRHRDELQTKRCNVIESQNRETREKLDRLSNEYQQIFEKLTS